MSALGQIRNWILVILLSLALAAPRARAEGDGQQGEGPGRRKVPRVVCIGLAVIGLGLTGGYLWLNFSAHESSERTKVSGGGNRVDHKQKDKTFFDGNGEVVVGFEREGPSVMIFDKNDFQRMASGAANDMVIKEEGESKWRSKLHQGPGLKVSIEGLAFKPSQNDPNRIEVTVIGPAREVPIAATVSRKDLEDGKEISLTFPKVGRNMGVAGTALGGGSLKFNYDKKAGAIHVSEFTSDFTMKNFGATNKDGGVITDFSMTKVAVERRPIIEQKYVPEWDKNARDPWNK